ncbi:hypothetical protein ACJX0J_039787, partial [Zea mays]
HYYWGAVISLRRFVMHKAEGMLVNLSHVMEDIIKMSEPMIDIGCYIFINNFILLIYNFDQSNKYLGLTNFPNKKLVYDFDIKVYLHHSSIKKGGPLEYRGGLFHG